MKGTWCLVRTEGNRSNTPGGKAHTKPSSASASRATALHKPSVLQAWITAKVPPHAHAVGKSLHGLERKGKYAEPSVVLQCSAIPPMVTSMLFIPSVCKFPSSPCQQLTLKTIFGRQTGSEYLFSKQKHEWNLTAVPESPIFSQGKSAVLIQLPPLLSVIKEEASKSSGNIFKCA